MKLRFAVMIAPVLALGVLAVAEAQQHKATRLGNPATRFAQKTPKKPDDIRVLLRSEKTKKDVAAVLNEVGWKGNIEDLDRAAASAEITKVQIAPGTRIPFMSSRKKGQAHALVDVLWAGPKPIDAFAFEMASNCQRYRVVTPLACGNFWVEDLGHDNVDPKCNVAPPPPPPVVSVSGASEVCVSQPVEYAITVNNPPADGKVALQVNGKELVSDKLTNGQFRFTFTGAPTPGTYEVKAISGGVAGTTKVVVKPCVPTCAIVATPLPAHAGKPLTIDVSGSRVAAGVKGGVKTAKVEIVDPKGNVTGTYDMTSGLVNNAVVIKKAGIHTVRAVVVDEYGQTSTNACTAQVDVKGGPPVFVGGYFGKERLTHDDFADHDDRPTPFTEFSRCSPIAGFNIGIQPKLNETTELEAAIGFKFKFDDDAHNAFFGDLAINKIASRGFFGGGISWWDMGKDSTGVGLLLQGGYDLTPDGKWQLVGQTRVPFFNQFDNIDNNYQFWGGIRFRPFSWK